uniref:Uncharacterized protein n=1 Tax=Anguilla anguilla TaxID=7936 RepID=A0A0E9TPA7_ANGAN
MLKKQASITPNSQGLMTHQCDHRVSEGASLSLFFLSFLFFKGS